MAKRGARALAFLCLAFRALAEQEACAAGAQPGAAGGPPPAGGGGRHGAFAAPSMLQTGAMKKGGQLPVVVLPNGSKVGVGCTATPGGGIVCPGDGGAPTPAPSMAPAPALSAAPAPAPAAGIAPPTCAVEQALRRMLRGQPGVDPALIRAVFHDALDKDNLLVLRNGSETWEPVPGSYGGVDGCLWSPLTGNRTGIPSPTHNRHVPPKPGFFHFARGICAVVCENAWPEGLRDQPLCESRARCELEAGVLGTLVAIEGAGGPRIPMSWGRERGACTRALVQRFLDSDLGSFGPELALDEAPPGLALDDASVFRRAFARMGFSPRDEVALLGAHTFGQMAARYSFFVGSGLLGSAFRGPFCSDRSKIREDMRGDDWAAPQESWASGGFWDRTPEAFDNDYYKLFAHDSFADKDVCCGRLEDGMCTRNGGMVRITARGEDWKATSSERLPEGPCGQAWCRDDRAGRSHMKNTMTWVRANRSFVHNPDKFGTQKRIVRVAAEWALLARDDTRALVKQFAQDQGAFFSAFTSAWQKVIGMSHSPLSSCSSPNPSAAEVDEVYRKIKCTNFAKCGPRTKCGNPKNWDKCPLRCGKCGQPLSKYAGFM